MGIYAKENTSIYEIELTENGAKWVEEEPWHPDEELVRAEGLSILLKVPGNHDMEIIPRVLAFGVHAKVISPQRCRKGMMEIIAKLEMSYQDE